MMMEAHEWRAVFASRPEPTLDELAKFMERRREEMREELKWFEQKWEGRTVKTQRRRELNDE